MKNSILSTCFLLVVFFLFCGFTWNPNKKANKIYVEASLEASKFLSSNEKRADDYSALWDSYKSVKEKIDFIFSEYPSSDIAVALLTEKIKISDLTLKQFRNKEKIVRLMKEGENSALSCALLAIEEIKDEKEKFTAIFSIAVFYAMTGQKEKVTHFLSQAFKFHKIIKKNEKSAALRRIALIFAIYGYLEHAYTTAETIDDASVRANIIVDITCEHADSMGKEYTVQMLLKAIEVAKNSDQYRDYYLEDITEKYISLGLLDKAVEVVDFIEDTDKRIYNFLKIAKKFLEANQKEKVISILSKVPANKRTISVAELYCEMGEKQKVELLLSQAIEENKNAYGYGKARQLGSISALYAKIGQYENADESFSQAISIADSITDKYAVGSIPDKVTSIDAISHIVCEYADVLKTEHATQLLLKTIEMIEPLRQENYLYSTPLTMIASKLSDLGQFEKVFNIIYFDKYLNSTKDPTLQSNISINFINHGRMDQAFELFQIRDSGTAYSLFLGDIFENYSNHKYTDQIESIFVKLLEVSEMASIEQYWRTGLDILGYYSKASLKEQELKLASTIFKKVQEKAGEDFIVEGLATIAVIHAKIGTNDQISNVLSVLLEAAHNTNKNMNKVALLTVAASIYDKTGLNPNSRDKLVLHNIVSAIDPLSNL